MKRYSVFSKEMWTLYNICMIPFVLFIRLPILYFITFFCLVGDVAEALYDWLSHSLPAFKPIYKKDNQ